MIYWEKNMYVVKLNTLQCLKLLIDENLPAHEAMKQHPAIPL
jgi:hypothetical protein